MKSDDDPSCAASRPTRTSQDSSPCCRARRSRLIRCRVQQPFAGVEHVPVRPLGWLIMTLGQLFATRTVSGHQDTVRGGHSIQASRDENSRNLLLQALAPLIRSMSRAPASSPELMPRTACLSSSHIVFTRTFNSPSSFSLARRRPSCVALHS